MRRHLKQKLIINQDVYYYNLKTQVIEQKLDLFDRVNGDCRVIENYHYGRFAIVPRGFPSSSTQYPQTDLTEELLYWFDKCNDIHGWSYSNFLRFDGTNNTGAGFDPADNWPFKNPGCAELKLVVNDSRMAGGTYTITINGQTTNAINYGTSADDVLDEVNILYPDEFKITGLGTFVNPFYLTADPNGSFAYAPVTMSGVATGYFGATPVFQQTKQGSPGKSELAKYCWDYCKFWKQIRDRIEDIGKTWLDYGMTPDNHFWNGEILNSQFIDRITSLRGYTEFIPGIGLVTYTWPRGISYPIDGRLWYPEDINDIAKYGKIEQKSFLDLFPTLSKQDLQWWPVTISRAGGVPPSCDQSNFSTLGYAYKFTFRFSSIEMSTVGSCATDPPLLKLWNDSNDPTGLGHVAAPYIGDHIAIRGNKVYYINNSVCDAWKSGLYTQQDNYTTYTYEYGDDGWLLAKSGGKWVLSALGIRFEKVGGAPDGTYTRVTGSDAAGPYPFNFCFNHVIVPDTIDVSLYQLTSDGNPKRTWGEDAYNAYVNDPTTGYTDYGQPILNPDGTPTGFYQFVKGNNYNYNFSSPTKAVSLINDIACDGNFEPPTLNYSTSYLCLYMYLGGKTLRQKYGLQSNGDVFFRNTFVNSLVIDYFGEFYKNPTIGNTSSALFDDYKSVAESPDYIYHSYVCYLTPWKTRYKVAYQPGLRVSYSFINGYVPRSSPDNAQELVRVGKIFESLVEGGGMTDLINIPSTLNASYQVNSGSLPLDTAADMIVVAFYFDNPKFDGPVDEQMYIDPQANNVTYGSPTVQIEPYSFKLDNGYYDGDVIPINTVDGYTIIGDTYSTKVRFLPDTQISIPSTHAVLQVDNPIYGPYAAWHKNLGLNPL